ncbi:Diacetylchitobiose uptake system ATP-binding protein MsiK [Roseobacter fucihabitans]|uniref:Diacetylchitobiose uptake system ATP-binding protein MsiK n=1 Tax=Roseobacter fucihabitans TaxID=1537242 RepID=A0ABZ2BTA2_9RHOB|nr:sn-glycerol-3-phosphate ABC transporter ATP-binding protein UgpC [Roseobacter litoralis]MBC6964493.1 sn-glycerol-3-phosphate import ATP-binding protein UgpC [Roseobacter litoralis]
MAGVKIKDIQKSYGAVQLIHGLNVEIADGEFLALVGPSGCGKSTLLRMIAGLEPINGGTVAIGERVANNLPPAQRDIAMVFQTYALYPHKSVGENMGSALKVTKVERSEIQRRVREAAEILSLTEYLDRKPRHFSGGQRQRVAMGRAIVRDPQVFLFDEPLSNLDAKLRIQMRMEIKELHQRLKTTTVFATHDQIEAMTLADRIVGMQAGRIEQIGTPLELYDNPANEFVATFIGAPSMNLLGAQRNGGVADLAGHRVQVKGSSHSGDVRLGVRPEHLRLVAAGEGVAMQVKVVEPTGSETMVFLRHDDQDITAVFRERHAFAPGETVHLAPDPDHLHCFDAASGQRVG